MAVPSYIPVGPSNPYATPTYPSLPVRTHSGIIGGPGAALMPSEEEGLLDLDPNAPVQVCLALADGSQVLGRLAADETWKLKTTFGEAELPARLIAGAQRIDKDQFRIALRNGDQLTGQLALERVRLSAAWGEVAIEFKHIASIQSKLAPRHLISGGQKVWKHEIFVRNPDGSQMIRLLGEDGEELAAIDVNAAAARSGQALPSALTPAVPAAFAAPMVMPAPVLVPAGLPRY